MKMTEQQLLEQGYRKYEGEKIDVFYDITLCKHAGKCVKGSLDVFNPKRKPWILPNAKQASEVASIIETCPTKALQYVLKEETQIDVTLEASRVVATRDGEMLGEMTFVDSGSFYIIDHTGVFDAARGLGVGKKLVAAFVAFTREKEMKILPLCPFAKAEFSKNDAYQDVLK